MAHKPITNPRKRASQLRSLATVEALVEATARILVRDGYDGASTNRIAELAGVSIGSLYQYFPSKEALVAAVIERHNGQLMRRVQAMLAEIAAQPLHLAIRRFVVFAIEDHQTDPQLRLVLEEQIPRVGQLANVDQLYREGHALMRAFLQGHREQLGVMNLDLAAYVCATTIEGLTHRAVLHQPELLRDTDALVDEITRLIHGYLRSEAA